MDATSSTTAFESAILSYQGAANQQHPLPGSGTTPFKGLTAEQRLARAKTAATDFEAMFVTSMLEHMYEGVKPNAMFGGGQAEGMYRSLLNQEYGKAIARSSSLGIARMVEKEMLHLQEVADK